MKGNVIVLRPTWKYALLRSLGLMLISLAIIAIAIYFQLAILLLVLMMPILIMCYRIIYWRCIKHEITTYRIKYIRGIFHRKVDFLELYRVKDFDQHQSLIMRLLKIMNIRLMTSDISHPVLEIRGIPESNIPDILRQLVEKSRQENRVYTIG